MRPVHSGTEQLRQLGREHGRRRQLALAAKVVAPFAGVLVAEVEVGQLHKNTRTIDDCSWRGEQLHLE